MVESTETRVREDAPVTQEERQEAVKLLIRLLGAAMAVVVAAGVATLLSRDDSGGEGGGDITLINAIGPLAGRDLTAYVSDRRNELGQARGPHAAVVSLAQYSSESDVRRLFDGVDIRALLVAAPGGGPTLVKGDLAAWAERTRAEAAEERKQFESLLPTYDPEDEAEFIEQARADIERLTKLERTVSSDGPVVFAVVVVADVAELRRLAATTGVRLVDVGADAELPEDTRIRGIRPEETTTAGDPVTRPA
jgi:hypothetical protein